MRTRGRVGWGAASAALLCGMAGADTVRQGGGDVSVMLFSTHRVTAVVVSPVGAGAWTAACSAGCARRPLNGPLTVSGRVEVFAGGSVRLREAATGEERAAAGLWHLRAGADGVDAVLTLPSERYVGAVLNAEAAGDEPAASLQALAVVARTFALNGRHYYGGAPGHLAPELCDSTACQAMRLGGVSGKIEEAVWATAGETLWFGGRRAEVYFSQRCGGVTEAARAVWPTTIGTGGAKAGASQGSGTAGAGGAVRRADDERRAGDVAYLQSHADPFCLRTGPAAWHTEVSAAELAAVARAEGWRLPERVVSVAVAARSGSGRALRVGFSGDDGRKGYVDAGALRLGIGRALGWDRVRSDLYEVNWRGGRLVFDGRGHGHGVGLCQAGAAEMAREGKTAREILRFYFPGTAVRILPEDTGWRTTRTRWLTVRGMRELSAGEVAELDGMWVEATRRFAPRGPVAAEVVFAPSTELFRQMAGEPGWALASTRGGRIVVQPLVVLRGTAGGEWGTLLHEMLHVVVEAEADGRTPVWLREGLVEELAGGADEAPGANGASAAGDFGGLGAGRGGLLSGGGDSAGDRMGDREMEAGLLHAGSRGESERAHRAARVRVRRLIGRYGLSSVRGWLDSGAMPPAA